MRNIETTDFNSIVIFVQRYCELSKQRLDRAILTFFQHFRKSYVGDQAMHSSKVMKLLFFFSGKLVVQNIPLRLFLYVAAVICPII